MALQGLTTKEPDDTMVEVALVAFLSAQGELSDEEMENLRHKYSHIKAEQEAPEAGNGQTMQAEN